MNEVKRGDIWIVDLDPTRGHEIKKMRPGVIVQNDFGNKYGSLTIVAPITSQGLGKIYPFEVFIEGGTCGLEKNSKVLINHIRSVDKVRLIKKIGKIDEGLRERIDDAIRVSLGLVNV